MNEIQGIFHGCLWNRKPGRQMEEQENYGVTWMDETPICVNEMEGLVNESCWEEVVVLLHNNSINPDTPDMRAFSSDW